MFRSTVKFLFAVLILLPSFVKGQVTANFTIDDTAGCAPMVVHFTNTSTGATSYSWNLGNGTLSSLTDVSGAYLTAGTYTITLVASNGSATSTRSMTIRVYALPTVNFTAADTTICPGGSVSFTSSVVSGAWGGVTYNWNFGDGLTSTLSSPSHTYALPGNYNVTLFATNSKGCINSRSKMPYVIAYTPPSVGFTVSNNLFCHPIGIATFTNTTVGTGLLSYFWRFGDGGTSVLPNPTRNYASSGLFSVSLRATDGNGCIDSTTYPDFITVGSMVSSFTAPSYACPYLPITFTNTSTTHLTSYWDFGDSTNSPDENPEHIYSRTGTFSVMLVVYDGSCFDTVRRTINIVQPSGSFTITPARPCEPPRVLTFNASVPSGCTVSWNSMNEHFLGTGLTVSHNFPFYTYFSDTLGFIDSVTMIITDSHGCKDTVGKRDTVNYLKVFIGGGPHSGCTPLTDTLIPILMSTVYNPFCWAPYYECGYPPPLAPVTSFGYPYSVSSYSWDFGDGTPFSSAPIPYHTYTLVGGVYWPRLTVVTSNGCTASSRYAADMNVRVGNVPPTPTFTITPTRACAGRPLRFTATATGTFDEYAWDYGDGNADSLATATHVYTVPGTYTVDLRTIYNGCRSLLAAKRDTIDSANAIAHLDFDCIPRTKVSFADWSSGDDTHLWQFGDGSTSTLFNPVHTYSAIGVYPVKLTTYNIASGCRDTMDYMLNIMKVVANLTVFDSTICKGARDTFSVDEVNEPHASDTSWIVQYNWYVDGVATDSLISTYRHDTTYHTFNVAGPHTVMAVLKDNHGCYDTLVKNIMVARPVDTFDFTPVTGCAPLSVTFTDRSTNVAGVSISSYFWRFGDGRTAVTTTPGVTHVYTANGIYTVKEVITDVFGCKDSLTKRTKVTANKPRAAFNASATTVCARRNVRFTNTTSGTFTCLWFFGDGDTSTAISPLHSYNSAGLYTVTLIVITPAGCRDTLTEVDYITVKGLPSPSFSMDDSFSVCSPFTVNFTNTSTGATSYFWTFGDGTASVVASPTTVYIRPGYFRVKLLAINSFSCTDTAIKYVTLFGYTGAFAYTPDHGCKPLSVAFTATVSAIASAIWDFSDGVTTPPSLSVSATHVYSSNGMYVPKLILTDSAGCTSASLGADTIKVDNIAADFITTPSPGCVSSPLTFNDTSSHYAPITSWLWTLAPGYTSTARTPVYTYATPGTHPVTLSITDAWGCNATVTKNVTVNTVPAAIGGPSVVCVGTSATLVNTVTGGLWSSSNISIATIGSVSGVVTGVATGTVTISYSLGSGCLATKVVTVNPGMSPISGSSTVCVNVTTPPFTNAAVGGVWSSSSPAVCTIGSLSGIATGIGAGVATISYTYTGCTVTKSITVNPLPSNITGNVPVCVSMFVTLASTPLSGTWSTGSSAVASVGVTSGIVTGTAAGTTSVTYTLTTGCRTTATVTVNNPPSSITGSGFVCIGGSSVLNSATTGGLWSSSNTGIVTVGSTSGIITGVTFGTTVISYTAGGCSTVKTVSVIVAPSAISGVNQVCIGQTTALSHTATGGIWSSASTSIAVVAGACIVTGMAVGTTTISYSLGGGCIVTTPFTVNPLPAATLGSNNLCVGVSATLTNPSVGGVWSSVSPGIADIDSFSGVVTGVSGGGTVINYTVATGCARTFLVTVNAVPPILGIMDMCVWDTIYISNSNPSGSYSSTGAFIASLGGGAGRVVAVTPGIATVTYLLTTGCSLTDTIVVHPLPSLITGTTHICQGTTTTLGNPMSGGRWNSSNGSIAAIDSVSGYVNGLSGGSVLITYTLPTGCKIDTPFLVTPIPYTGTILGPSSICVGQTVTLVDSFSGGVWSASNGSATVLGGNVTGMYAGIDTIKYEIANACGSSSSTHIITVVAIPDAGNITGPSIVCEGDTIQLINSVTGGVWSNLNNRSMVTVSGLVTGINPGIDTIIYTFTNMCGIAKAKHGILINPLPDAGLLTGPSSVCIGGTIVIASSITGGTLGISNSNATLNGWVVTGVKTGFDTLSYLVTNSCGTATTLKQIVIDSLPYAGIISGGHDLCIGDSLALNASIPGGDWSESGDAISIKGSVIVTGIASGTDIVSYIVTNNCGTSVVMQAININPLPDSLMIERNGYTLSVPGGYAAYQWTLNGIHIPGATNNHYIYKAGGSYGVVVTNGFGCSFVYSDYNITDCTIDDIQVFPNPTAGKVSIQWCKKVSVRVNVMDGKLVKEVMSTNEVDLHELPNGIYSLTIYDLQNNKLLTKRVTLIR